LQTKDFCLQGMHLPNRVASTVGNIFSREDLVFNQRRQFLFLYIYRNNC